jgi:hypothetical protein
MFEVIGMITVGILVLSFLNSQFDIEGSIERMRIRQLAAQNERQREELNRRINYLRGHFIREMRTSIVNEAIEEIRNNPDNYNSTNDVDDAIERLFNIHLAAVVASTIIETNSEALALNMEATIRMRFNESLREEMRTDVLLAVSSLVY